MEAEVSPYYITLLEIAVTLLELVICNDQEINFALVRERRLLFLFLKCNREKFESLSWAMFKQRYRLMQALGRSYTTQITFQADTLRLHTSLNLNTQSLPKHKQTRWVHTLGEVSSLALARDLRYTSRSFMLLHSRITRHKLHTEDSCKPETAISFAELYHWT